MTNYWTDEGTGVHVQWTGGIYCRTEEVFQILLRENNRRPCNGLIPHLTHSAAETFKNANFKIDKPISKSLIIDQINGQ